MSTNKQIQEQISALVDGELSDVQVDQVLAVLRTPQGRAAWEDFHRIGDSLRSDDMAFAMSEDFVDRLSARLEAEPAIVAPVIVRAVEAQQQQSLANESSLSRRFKRFTVPGAVAAAIAATAAFIGGPQLMVAYKDKPNAGEVRTVLVGTQPAASGAVAAVHAEETQNGVVLRDPRIDEYLLAHQRFSPSVFSTAQYARSATFATDSGK
ncbi:MAG: sigma-E factor negative regulatory protein [Burkholderiales bacterium]|nr:sigma-E factor negative regulatory protein [Burkholderiales bacterium]